MLAIWAAKLAGRSADGRRYFSEPESARHLCGAAIWRMDPAQMEGLIRINTSITFSTSTASITSKAATSRHGPDEVALPSRDEHVPSDAETISYVNRRPRVHAAGNGESVCHALRHGQRPGGLPCSFERKPDAGRHPGSRAVQSAADVFGSAGRVGSAAVRRQRAFGDCAIEDDNLQVAAHHAPTK